MAVVYVRSREHVCHNCDGTDRKEFHNGVCPECDNALIVAERDKYVICKCGYHILVSDPFHVECPGPGCKRHYNCGGQQLRPPDQWGEETGECLSDIIGPRSNRCDL